MRNFSDSLHLHSAQLLGPFWPDERLFVPANFRCNDCTPCHLSKSRKGFWDDIGFNGTELRTRVLHARMVEVRG
jgi:hypothetical protein